MSAPGTQLSAPPDKGIANGEFFHREDNPFRDLDNVKQPTITEAEEEMETNVLHRLLPTNFVGCAIQSIKTRCSTTNV